MEFGDRFKRKYSKPKIQSLEFRRPIHDLNIMKRELRDIVASDARLSLKNMEKISEGVDHAVVAMQIFALKRRAITMLREINNASELELYAIVKKLIK